MMRFVVSGLLFLVFLGLYGGLNGYVGWHGLFILEHWLGGLSAVTKSLYWCVFSILPLSYIVTRLPFVRGRLEHLLQWIGSWYIAVFYFSLLLLPLLNLLSWGLLRWSSWSEESVYLGACCLYVIVLSALFLRGSWNARHPIVRQHTLKLPSEKSALLAKPLKIVVASDLHLGHMVGKTHLLRLLEIVRDSKPDLVLLPGDVVDDDPQAFVDNGLDQVMQAIVAESRLGAYAVLGNHEYYGRQIERYVEIMAGIGVNVLRDEVVSLTEPPIEIVGRKDVTAEQFARPGVPGRLPIAQLVGVLDQQRPIIMMDHQPKQFAAALAGGVDLLLCGHTHRGQFAPNHWITRSLFELDWGYMLKQDTTDANRSMHVLVSSGFGTWGPPIRLASRAEVLEITLL